MRERSKAKGTIVNERIKQSRLYERQMREREKELKLKARIFRIIASRLFKMDCFLAFHRSHWCQFYYQLSHKHSRKLGHFTYTSTSILIRKHSNFSKLLYLRNCSVQVKKCRVIWESVSSLNTIIMITIRCNNNNNNNKNNKKTFASQ